jgi:hypothetical protein
MGAVAYLTELSNTATVNKVLSKVAAPAFQKSPVMLNLIYAEDMPDGQGTATKGFKRKGSLTAAALAQSTALAVDANGERTDTALDVTAAKAVVVSGVTVENQKFGQVDLVEYAEDAGTAIGNFVDNQILALFSSITNLVTSTAGLTLNDLDEAQLNILAAGTPDPNMPLTFVGATRAMRNLKQEIREAGGSAMQNDRFLSIFNGSPQANGFYGSLPGYELYHTASGLGTTGGNNIQALFHSKWAFAGIFDKQISTWYANKGSEGFYTEIASYYFWGAGLWNDGAACEVQSDT